MKKISWIKLIWLALFIANRVAEALNDPTSPGHITADELKRIIADAVAFILSDPK